MNAAFKANASVYLRAGKSDLGAVHADVPVAKVGGLLQIKRGDASGLSFIATGSLVRCALDIAETSHAGASVWSVPFIKPIDESQIVDICKNSSAVITFEEHSIHGGLGSLVAGVACEHSPVRVLRIGVQDRFSEYCGTYSYLLKEHGLDRDAIEDRLAAFLSHLA
jgi:transketolase